MLTININPTNKTHLKLIEQASDMNLAKKITEDTSLNTPVLTEGSNSITGILEIESYLEEQKAMIIEWYACRCGTHDMD